MSNAAQLAMGRIFEMLQRAAQSGDVEEYERCREIVLAEVAPTTQEPSWRPNYARDRRRGAP